MQTIHELGASMPYPGRFLILGNNDTHFFNIYGVTARSPVNQCRRYVFNSNETSIAVESTDIALMSQGDLTLLDYKAVQIFPNGVITSNGRQINLISSLDQKTAHLVLDSSLASAEYEHDKYHTPRITGCTMQHSGVWTQALHIVRDNGSGSSEHNSFDIPVSQPAARFISTYAGPNIRPTPYFTGSPIDIQILTGDAEEISKSVYSSFAPPSPSDQDVRVSVMTILIDRKNGDTSSSILNAVDL